MGKFFSATDIRSEISKMYPDLDQQEVSYHCYMILSNSRIEYTHSYSELREIIKNWIDEPEVIDISKIELCDLDDFDFNEGI